MKQTKIGNLPALEAQRRFDGDAAIAEYLTAVVETIDRVCTALGVKRVVAPALRS